MSTMGSEGYQIEDDVESELVASTSSHTPKDMLESFSNTWQQPSVSPDPWHCEPYWHCNCSSLMGFCALAAVPAAPPTVHCFSQVPSASAAPSRVSFAPRIALQAWQGSPNPAPEKCNLCCNHTSPSKHLIPYHFPISFSSVAINQFLH